MSCFCVNHFTVFKPFIGDHTFKHIKFRQLRIDDTK